MDVIDRKKEREEEERRYLEVIALADKFFGKERIFTRGRGYEGSRNDFYVDFRISGSDIISSIEVILTGTTGATIMVHDESKLEEAERFGKEYEQKFNDSHARMEHNLR